MGLMAAPDSAHRKVFRRLWALRPFDRLLVLVLMPLWLVSLALHVQGASQGLLGTSALYFAGASGPGAYPTVAAVMPDQQATLRAAGLQVGDELLQVGAVDLRGKSALAAGVEAFGQRQPGRVTPLVFRHGAVVAQVDLPVARLPVPWWWPALFSTSFALVGLLIILRAPQSRAARTVFPAFLAFAFTWLPVTGYASWRVWLSIIEFAAGMFFTAPLLLRTALLLPEASAPAQRWVFALPWLFVVMAPVAVSAFLGVPIPPDIALRLHPLLQVACYAALLVILVANYRRADAVGRRQVRWVLFGFFLALGPALVVTAVVAFHPAWFMLYTVSGLGLPLVPLAFLVAIVRYNLFDINRLISVAASYSILSILFLGGVFLLVPQLANASAAAADIDPLLVQVALSLGLAMAGIPLHRRLRPLIDRLFFPERHAIEANVQALLAELPDCASPQALFEAVGQRLAATSADPLVIFGRIDQAFSTVYAKGRGLPQQVRPSAAFQAVLMQHQQARLVASWAAGLPAAGPLAVADHALLDTLGDGVLMPVRGHGALAALVFIGPKRSGDIYTRNELTLLTAAAQQFAGELQRFAAADLLDQARAMQDRMRRYVPGAIARQIDVGASLDEEQREVSVLFVDIRGYTAIAEGMRPADIFQTINRYTQQVSDIVQEEGGMIVEFNGDGMMTVFGAPLPLADKEAAAVRAARRIVGAMGQDGQAPAGASATPAAPAITVGVGIATGEAYLGNVRAVDRLIWTALGNTTNLAARLQSLSRDLQATIVVDDATWARAGSEARGFVNQGPTLLRGRSAAVVVHSFGAVAGPQP